MTAADSGRPRRLDERVEPGWAALSENLLKYGGLAVGLFVLWLGFLTGGFFMLLTVALASLAVVGGWLLGSYVARESWYRRADAKPITALAVVGFPVALIATAQLLGPALTPPPTLEAEFSGVLARDEQATLPLSVDPRVSQARFSLQVSSLEGGALRWFVEDGSGTSRWSGRTDSPGMFHSGLMAPLAGAWTLHLVSEADQAVYRLSWRGWTADQTPGPPDGG